jgi:hypothetical protein
MIQGRIADCTCQFNVMHKRRERLLATIVLIEAGQTVLRRYILRRSVQRDNMQLDSMY